MQRLEIAVQCKTLILSPGRGLPNSPGHSDCFCVFFVTHFAPMFSGGIEMEHWLEMGLIRLDRSWSLILNDMNMQVSQT